MSENKLPNFFIIGAHKGGTTSLYQYMKSIPEIYFPKYIKEPHYFVNPNMNYFPRPIKDFQNYQKLFQGVKNEQAIGEASATYLAHPETPSLIHEKIPNAKIIVSLRNPINRTQSAFYGPKTNKVRSFHNTLKIAFNDKNFEKPLSFFLLKNSFYSDALEKYQDTFGKGNVLVLIFEEWVKQPKNAIEDIQDFLNLPKTKFEIPNKAYNQFIETRIPRIELFNNILTNVGIIKFSRSYIPLSTRKFLGDKVLSKKTESKPKMRDDDKELLKKYFDDDVKRLSKNLKRKLPWNEFN